MRAFTFDRRIRSAVGLTAASLTIAGGLAVSQPARPAEGAVSAALPTVGSLDARGVIFGSVTSGSDAGETWAYRQLPLDSPPSLVGSKRLTFGPIDPSSANGQLGFFKASDGVWQLASVPLDAAGNAMRGPTPNPRGTRMDSSGSAVVVGRDGSRAAGQQLEVLARSPGGDFQELDAPPTTVLLGANDPSSGDAPESLAENQGVGDVNVAVATQSGRAVVFDVPNGRSENTAVIVNDGRGGSSAWHRESIEVGSDPLHVDAIASAGSTDAVWIAGHGDSTLLQTYRRVTGTPAKWQAVELPSGPLTNSAQAANAAISDVRPLDGKAQTLTVTGPNTAWVDMAYTKADETRYASVFIDASKALASRIETWCDDSFCDHKLVFDFDKRNGYSSFAWQGSGHGDRVITNPLRVGAGGGSNDGTWVKLVGDSFERQLGGGGSYRPSAAFSSPGSGWIQGPVQVGASLKAPQNLADWPISARAPLTAVVAEPLGDASGEEQGAVSRGAMAVGLDGQVARYTKESGWTREFLQSSSGAVVSANLRGVAWPEPGLAFAVGDLGALWRWRSDTGLWERDPGAPVGFEENLMAVAFDPTNPQRGYAVGKGGTVLAYGKTWSQDSLPPAFTDAKFTGVAFAGPEAVLVSNKGVIFNSGDGWHTDPSLDAVLASLAKADLELNAVAALADGSVVIGGRSLVIKRDGQEGAWRFAAQPLPGSTVIAVGAFKDGGAVRAVVSVVRQLDWPLADPTAEPDPNAPPPLMPPYLLPGDGYVLRETSDGWRDEQRTAFGGSGPDRPLKTDPALAFLLDSTGAGWVVGGWSGFGDDAGRGAPLRSSSATVVRRRVQTTAVLRYDPAGSPAQPAAAVAAPVALPAGPVRIAIGGHPQCESACADLANQGIAPDRLISSALDEVATMATKPHGPAAFVSTGSRIRPGSGVEGDPSEEARYAELLRSRSGLPTYTTVAEGDVAGGSVSAFGASFAGAPAPMGSGDSGSSISRAAVPSTGRTRPGALTHYAFDVANDNGAVRVVVIDNSSGSLVASDGHQNPAEPQEQWLANVLDDAAAKRIAAIVVGSRDLNSRAKPALNLADDADRIAALLVAHGASAYFFDRPEENRTARIPAGASSTLPQFGTGALGYRSSVQNASSLGIPDALFGSAGFLLAEVDSARRDAITNVAPVAVRLIPVIDSLSMLALDGNQVRRSRPSLFQGIGRRPVSGDRWGEVGGDGVPDPGGADPYTAFPAVPCQVTGCSTRIDPEFTFTSKDPDLLDFVSSDTASSNLRKPLIGADDKVVRTSSSGLACPFNAGKTVVTLSAGGRGFSMPVEVLDGSVLRPCGTMPLNPSRFVKTPQPNPEAAAPPPAASPLPAALPVLLLPPPPAAPPAAVPSLFSGFFGGASGPPSVSPPVSPPPPPPTFFANPVPPGGSTVKVEKREEEVAPEGSSAASAYRADDHLPLEPFMIGMMIIAGLAGTTLRPGRRRDPAYSTTRVKYPDPASRGR